MRYFTLGRILKSMFATLFIGMYSFFVYSVYFNSIEPLGFIGFVRHGVLVTGLVPLLCWLAMLYWSNPKTRGWLFLIASIATIYHVFVFGTSAHADGLLYWGVQAVEVLLLWPVVVLSKRKNA